MDSAPGKARFSLLEAWVHTDVNGWALAGRLNDTQYRTLLAAASDALKHHVQPNGAVVFDAPALIATLVKT